MTKKIILITLLIISVNTYAVEFGIDQSGASGQIDQSGASGEIDQSGAGDSFQSNTDGYTSDNAAVMLGDDGGAQSAGLGDGQQSITFDEWQAANGGGINGGFNTDNKSVPKLSVAGLVFWLVGILNQLVYVIIGASLVVFLYGILKLSFIDGQKPEAREQARKFMFWGIVSLFVMVSVWGLVKLLQATFFNTNSDLIFPMFK